MHTYSYLIPVVAVANIMFVGTVQAASSPHYLITDLGTASGITTYEIDADSGGNGISASEVLVVLPATAQYKSSDTTVSKFDTEVTPPSFTKGQYHIVRAALAKDGLMGTAIPVARFSVTNAGTLPTIDITASKMIRYSDSSDLLHPTVSRTIVTSAAPKPAATTPSYQLPIAIGLGVIALLATAALFLRRKKS